MNMSAFIIGFLSVIYSESRRMLKGFFSSYFWFILLVLISTYTLFAEKYSDVGIDRSLLSLKSGDNPMTDILIFTTSFAISSASEVISGKTPSMVFPTSIGVIFFIIFPLMLGLTLMSNFIIRKASTSIAGEREKKVLYILATSPQTKASIYLGKFIGIFLLTLPMIGVLYFITEWVFTSLFSSAFNLSELVLKTSLITSLLFASAGMLVSVLFRHEKAASWLGTRIVAIAALLTTLWIIIPFIEFILNMTNNSTDFLLLLEKLTWISPFTMDVMSVYSPAVSAGYFSIQLIAAFILLMLGMVTFIRQDIEY